MSDLEKFNVDSDLQSIADAMTVAGLNFCGGVFDHLETGEEFELTIAKKSGVRSMADEIAELREVLSECRGALSACSIQESRNDGTENRMKIKALDKLVESVDLTLAKHK